MTSQSANPPVGWSRHHVEQQREPQHAAADRRLVVAEAIAEPAGVEPDPLTAVAYGAERSRGAAAQRGRGAPGPGHPGDEGDGEEHQRRARRLSLMNPTSVS